MKQRLNIKWRLNSTRLWFWWWPSLGSVSSSPSWFDPRWKLWRCISNIWLFPNVFHRQSVQSCGFQQQQTWPCFNLFARNRRNFCSVLVTSLKNGISHFKGSIHFEISLDLHTKGWHKHLYGFYLIVYCQVGRIGLLYLDILLNWLNWGQGTL